jgi:2-oxoglutarate/2-oxoacid ferredoxin oxidoreductase subunit alpha
MSTATQPTKTLCSGSEAIARSAMAAGLRFYAGYPMAPSTDILETFTRELGGVGGVCINVETEIEGVNMALGASMTGFRAATGSTGQGVALMQEAIAEAGLHETPLVVFTVGRMQQDYFQSTRGGGWGDYRTICLAPKDVPEAAELTQLLFHLTDRYRVPGVLLLDGVLARTQVSVDLSPIEFEALPPKSWALDGTGTGTGESKSYWTFAGGKANAPGPGPQTHWTNLAEKFERIARVEPRWEEVETDEVETLIVAFGTAAAFVEHVVRELRAEGVSVGLFRPITVWPFPGEQLEAAAASAKAIGVFELNAGQMIDDVRLNVPNRKLVRPIGGISVDDSGINIGELLDAPVVKARIEQLIKEMVA